MNSTKVKLAAIRLIEVYAPVMQFLLQLCRWNFDFWFQQTKRFGDFRLGLREE